MQRRDTRPRRRLDPEERREAILAAAVDAFAAQPYDRVGIATLAADVGASEALVYRYFTSKADLYAHVVQLAVDDLRTRQAAALATIAPGAPARDTVRTSLHVYLDHVRDHPTGWSAPQLATHAEPEAAAAVRREARRDWVERLATLLRPDGTGPRDDYALWGFYGFVDAACLHWVTRGCRDEERGSLVDAALGALEGALGDWGR
ncbi:TetR/AcrR family transcriptional regulator [Actinotalea subterranea]|uniref:TetR/AcrR family transcriptional regulator n=1 Tax=Actinotalea subterranea TaxID=2607497 RepID=UPI0011EEE500|nr:TetR/AcrR family transcriptional regulator [Actinotalea subterranea]